MSRAAAFLLAATALGLAPAAGAQEDAQTEARRLFEEAQAAALEGRTADAASRFRRSLERFPTAAAAYNLAVTLGDAGALVEARSVAEDILEGRFGELPDERRTQVGELAAQLRAGIATLEIEVSGVERAAVRIDGRDAGEAWHDAALTVAVDPGDHVVAASADGADDVSREVRTERGQRLAVRLELSLRAAVAPAGRRPDSRAPDDRSGVHPAVWIALGVAVVAAGVTVAVLATRGDDALPAELAFGRVEALGR